MFDGRVEIGISENSDGNMRSFNDMDEAEIIENQGKLGRMLDLSSDRNVEINEKFLLVVFIILDITIIKRCIIISMRVCVCCSLSFTDKVKEIAKELEKLGHEVLLPSGVMIRCKKFE